MNKVKRFKTEESSCLEAGGICLFLVFVLAATAMMALTANGDTGTDRSRILMIVSKAETAASEKAIRSIKAQLSDLEIDFQVVWIEKHSGHFRDQTDVSKRLAEKHNATIVFWSDLSVGNQVFLYVSEPGGGRILVRSIPFENDEQGDRFDVIALIVRTTVEAITGGGQIGVSPLVPSSPPRRTRPMTDRILRKDQKLQRVTAFQQPMG